MKTRKLAIQLAVLSALALLAASSAKADFAAYTLGGGRSDLTGNGYMPNHGMVTVDWTGTGANSTASVTFTANTSTITETNTPSRWVNAQYTGRAANNGSANVPDGANTAILLGIVSLGVWLLKRFFVK